MINKSSALKLLFINVVFLTIVFTESPSIYPEHVKSSQPMVEPPFITDHRIHQGHVQAIRTMATVQVPQNLTQGIYQHQHQNVNGGQDNNQVQSNGPNEEQGSNGFNPINRMCNLYRMKNPKFGRSNGSRGQKGIKSEIAKLKLENKELFKFTKRLIKDKVYYRRKLKKLRKKYGIKKNKRSNRGQIRMRGNKIRNRRRIRMRANKRRNRGQISRENKRRNRRRIKMRGNNRRNRRRIGSRANKRRNRLRIKSRTNKRRNRGQIRRRGNKNRNRRRIRNSANKRRNRRRIRSNANKTRNRRNRENKRIINHGREHVSNSYYQQR